MSKVLFLDIDGVLNSNFWNDRHQAEISDGTLIDEEKIKLLALLIRETNAEIILHSGWRFWFDAELKPLCTEAGKLVEQLEKEHLYISGVTPDLTIGLTLENVRQALGILLEKNHIFEKGW